MTSTLTPPGTAPAPAATAIWAPGRRALTGGLLAAVTLIAFESLSVTTILPKVTHQLGQAHLYGWVVSAFTLGALTGTALVGHVVDRFGVLVPAAAGLSLFAAGLTVDGLAPTLETLIPGRLLQGVGAGTIEPVSLAVIASAYPPAVRLKMIAATATAWVVPAAIGPAAAAQIANHFGWRWVFLGLLAPVAAAAAVVLTSLRGVGRPYRTGAPRPPIVPMLFIVAGAASIVAGLQDHHPVVAAASLLAGGAGVVFALRSLAPPGTLTAAPGMPATIVTQGLLAAAFFSVHAFVPYALETVRGATMLTGGSALSAAVLAWAGVSWTQVRLGRRWGLRSTIRRGLIVVAGAIAAMTIIAVTPDVPAWTGVIVWAVAGAGMGLAYTPLTTTAISLAANGEEGRVTAAMQLFALVGQTVGISLAGAAIAGDPSSRGTAVAFTGSVALVVAIVLLTRRLPMNIRTPTVDQQPAQLVSS